jgi:hypothetical protein
MQTRSKVLCCPNACKSLLPFSKASDKPMTCQCWMLLPCTQAPAAADDSHNLAAPLLAARAQEGLQQHPEVSGSGVKFVLKEGLMLCIPTGFDLAATTLMNVGLLFVAASGKRTRETAAA